MNRITYIFTNSRSNRIDDHNYADEFFYGLRYLKNKHKTNIIEFNSVGKYLSTVEHFISKLFSLPLYIFSINNKQNRKILRETDELFLVSESTAFAALPLLVLYKKKYKIKTNLFVMGLYSKKINFPKLKFLHNFLITFLSNYIDKYYFLGKGELEKAKKISEKHNNMEFLPFCIDTDFWNIENIDLKNNEYVLFVGNDGNRDYKKVFEIAQKMPEKKFIFITKNKILINSNLVNVEVIDGSWGSNEISDLKLLEIYGKAKLVILPLLNTLQPSGQSVSLQAMSLGVPVMISLTDGFWDIEKFSNNKNIIFVENNSVDSWINKINNIYKDPMAIQMISKNAKDLVNTNYSLKKLNNFLANLIT